MLNYIKQRIRHLKPTRPKLFYEGATSGYALPKMTVADSVQALEPRIMFDAAGVVTGAEVAADDVAQDQADQVLSADNLEAQAVSQDNEQSDELIEALTDLVPPAGRNELIFIDKSVEDYQSLLAGISSDAELIFIDSNSDGLEQIANVLNGRNDIDAIHIVSHGDAGQLQLGNTVLTQESMQGEHADELATIKTALSESADILIYGCNFAEGDFGKAAAESLAEITGADIAASVDLTGATSGGGDWELEQKIGTIETEVFASAESLEAFSGTLAAVTLDSGATAQAMVDTMSTPGNGLNITNPDKHSPPGDDLANGTFSDGTAAGLAVDSGVVFTTGRLTDLADDGDGTNDALSTNNTNLNSDDTELDTVLTDMGIANGNQVDRSEFTHNFTVNSGITKIAVQYVVGTDTDLTTVSSSSNNNNDAFGIFMTTDLDGVGEPNNGAAWTTVAADSLSSLEDAGAFVSGKVTGGTEAAGQGTEFDHITNARSSVVTVADDGTQYYMKFELADMSGSTGNDTAVFLSYFGSSISLDADANDDSGATGFDYQDTFNYDPASTGISIVDSDATLTNFDTTNITSATITIGTGFDSTNLPGTGPGDVLNFSTYTGSLGNIIGAYDSNTGVLNLSGDGTADDYLAAIKTITFNTYSETTGARDISIVVNDGTTNSNTVTSTITVSSVNQAPNDVADFTVNVIQGTLITPIDVSTTDPDGVDDTLTYGITGGTLPAGLSMNAAGQITGTPDNNAVGGTITITAEDEAGYTVTYDVVINVSNPVPTVSNTTVAATQGSSVGSLDVRTGSDDDAITYSTTDALPNGLTFTNGLITGTATAAAASATITVTALDAEGASDTYDVVINVSAPPISDTTPPGNPTIDTIEIDNIINAVEDDDVLLSGTAEANSTVDITMTDGTNTVTRQVTANGVGVWTIAGSEADLSGFNEGVITVTATATDAAGNTSGVTTTTPVYDSVDPLAPNLVTISTDSGIAGDLITNDNTLTFSGTAESNATVEVFIGGASIGTTTANGAGAWFFDYTGTTLADGIYVVTTQATDVAGNVSALSGSTNVIVDTSAPSVPTINITEDSNNDGTINNAELVGNVDISIGLPGDAVAGDTLTVTDGLSTKTITLTAGQITAGSVATNFSAPATGSTMPVTARITDVAGNVGVAGSKSVLITASVATGTSPGTGTSTGEADIVPDEIFNADNTPAIQPSQTAQNSSGTRADNNLSAQKGAVVDTVSNASSLGSMAALGGKDGAVLDAVEGANNQRVYFGDKVDNGLADNVGLWDAGGIKGFSVSFTVSENQSSEAAFSLFPLREGLAEVESKDQLIVKSILRDRSLFLEVDYSISSDPNLSIMDISVLMVDGSVLPDWLRVDDGGGLVSGAPPIGTEKIDLRIEVSLSDGTKIIRYVDVNVSSGEIAALEQVGDEFVAGASLFENQIEQEVVKFDNSIDKIKKALIN